MSQSLIIDIVSDVVCPFCYIGRRHLQIALENLGGNYTISWLPFQLNPDIPETGINKTEHMIRKFGSAEKMQQSEAFVTEAAANIGLHFQLERQQIQPNTFAMHMLIDYCSDNNAGDAAAVAFLKAFFQDGVDLTEKQNLFSIVSQFGISQEQFDAILIDEDRKEKIRYLEYSSKSSGISGVPVYIFNGSFAVKGAQPVPLFEQAIKKALTVS